MHDLDCPVHHFFKDIETVLFYDFMGMIILLACVSVYHEHAWCPWRLKEDTEFPGPRVKDGCEPVLGIEAGPLEERPELSATEASLQPP